MSGVFKAVGKVFKSVVKVVKKIAIPVLMIGAVALTAGAALGALPALGTILGAGGLGLSGTMASVVGGAISMGAVGAVTGGLKAAVTGGDIWKGAQGGFVVGAVTGGVMGGVGLISPNGVLADMGIGSSASRAQGLLDSARQTASTVAGGVGRAGASMGQANAFSPSTSTIGAPPPIAGSAGGAPGGVMGGAGDIVVTGTRIGAAAAGGASTLGTASALAGTAGSLLTHTGQGSGGSYDPPQPNDAPTGGSRSGGLGLSKGDIIKGIGQGAQVLAGALKKDSSGQDQLAALQQQSDQYAYNYGVTRTRAVDKKGRPIIGGQPVSEAMTYQYAGQNFAQPDGGLLNRALAPSNPPGTYFQIGPNGQIIPVTPGQPVGMPAVWGQA